MNATAEPTSARMKDDDDRASGPRLVESHPPRRRGAGDPYARVLSLDASSGLSRLLWTVGFLGLAFELHALARVWISGLTRVSALVERVPPLFALVVCATCGVAALVFPARGNARRTWIITGVIALGMAGAIGATEILARAVPGMSEGLRTELAIEGRALVGGTFAGLVLYSVLAAFQAPSPAVRAILSAAFALATMATISIVAHLFRPVPELTIDNTPIDVTLDEPPPPPPPPTAEPDEPKPEPKAVPLPLPTAAPPLPSPAQAAKVVAVEPDPNKPLDFTNTIIQGTANEYAGGVTSSEGTSNQAVRNVAAQNGGVPNGAGNEPNAPAVQQAARPSRARPAGLMSHDWRCPFPPEADTAQIDEALVMLDVTVRADGTPASVRILRDPGNGFGRMAYQCAMRQRFVTALDADGNSIQGVVRAPVHFNR
jgi:protein TonB